MAIVGPETTMWPLTAARFGHPHHGLRWQVDLPISLLLTAAIMNPALCPVLIRHTWPVLQGDGGALALFPLTGA